MTQDTTKQLGLARRGTGSRFSWVEGKKLYLCIVGKERRRNLSLESNTLITNGAWKRTNTGNDENFNRDVIMSKVVMFEREKNELLS